jgi:hypothetical protein
MKSIWFKTLEKSEIEEKTKNMLLFNRCSTQFLFINKFFL